MEPLQAVKGMNDVLPGEIGRWQRVERLYRETTARHGYHEVRTPIVEPTALFVRAIGETTDVVEKEMYTFVDKGEHSLTLRPEGTASAVRAYLEHAVASKEPVTKWIYLGPMFRRERPAKGRYRQFYQAGAEVIGDPGPYVDAEMIDMLVGFLSALGVKDVEVRVNSLGGPESREAYRAKLLELLAPMHDVLSPDSQRRLTANPLRILDSKDPRDQEITKGLPTTLAYLSEADAEHFEGLQKTLDLLGTPYRVDPKLVRGLDYYTRTLFEIVVTGGELGAQSTICGGGRYDGLVEQLGGQSTPAIGFAFGIERVMLAGETAADLQRVDAVVIAASPAELPEAVRLARELRSAGLVVDADLRGQSIKSQLRRADKLGAATAVILGGDELARAVAQVKDLARKTQEDVPRETLVAFVARIARERAA